MTTPVLEATDLCKYFKRGSNVLDSLLGRTNEIRAVDEVSLSLARNEVKGVIGESGCGKSTLLRTLVGLEKPTDGSIRYKGRPTSEFGRADWKAFRSNVQIIFQDPFNSLDPKMTVEETLREPLKIHGMDDRDRRVREALEHAELNPPEKFLGQKPDQMSGGEKQRVSIARALVVEPDVLLADEPVSMLDVSTQAAILNLLADLVDRLEMSMLYISHDLSTVSHVCEEVNVMYLGRIIETGPTGRLLSEPKHPYSQALIDAIPIPDPHHHRERTSLEGSPGDPVDLGEGCRFRDRCPEEMAVCERTPEFVVPDGDEDRRVACHLYYDHDAHAGSDRSPTGETATGATD